MPEGVVHAQLSLCHTLQSLFSAIFPRCLVVPFGAPLSGHAMLTSDCDLCLITEPSAKDQLFLTGEQYLPSQHLALLERVTTATPSSLIGAPIYLPAPPSSASLPHLESQDEDLDSIDSSSTTSSCSSPTRPHPPPIAPPTHHRGGHGRGTHCPPEFNQVLTMIQSLPGSARVVPIPSARCPIVKFFHLPTGTHCDLSINNRLLPATLSSSSLLPRLRTDT